MFESILSEVCVLSRRQFTNYSCSLYFILHFLRRSSQVFTVVGFNRYKGHPLSGHGVHEEVPETLAGHVGFWMSYDTMTAPESHNWGYR